MKFSQRILSMQYSPIRKLVPYADEAMKSGVKVYVEPALKHFLL